MDWKKYWTEFPRRFDERDFCFQVGRFSRGRATDPRELAIAVAQVHEGLELVASDRVLDLCCGNGLLTARYCGRCSSALGVDFSEELLQVARRYHQPAGVSYLHSAVQDLSPTLLSPGERFDKVSMFESLQYFEPGSFDGLLAAISSVASPGHRIYLSGVLDHDRQLVFLDTPERRRRFEEQSAQGQHEMGHWWTRDHLVRAGSARGYRVAFRDQHHALNTAHYRFDVLLVHS